MPSTLFEQARMIQAQIRSNYFAILHENDELRKQITKLIQENDRLKNDIKKAEQEISSDDNRSTN